MRSWLILGSSGIIGHGVLYVLLFGVAAAGLSGKLPRGKVVTMAVGGVLTVLTALNYMQFSGNTGDVAGPGSNLAIGFGVWLVRGFFARLLEPGDDLLLARLIEDVDGLEVVGEAANGEEAVAQARAAGESQAHMRYLI